METRRKNTFYGKCRCCNAEGHHRDLMKEYNLNGKKEIYYNMIMECFNLFLSTTAEFSKLICGDCITRLRDAVAFRSMVSTAEQQLLGSSHDKETIFINVPAHHAMETDIKTEVIKMKTEPMLTDDESPLCDGDGTLDYESDVPLCVVRNEIKKIDSGRYPDRLLNVSGYLPELLKPISEMPKSGKDDLLVEGEADFVAKYHTEDFRLPTRTSLYTNGLSSFVQHLDMLKGKFIYPKMLEKLLEQQSEQQSYWYDDSKVYITEKMAHIHNITTLLLNSNATPFKSKNRLGFPCYYCRNIFENLDKLKEHQAKMHNRGELRKILNGYGVESIAIYADITDLKCAICDENIPKLNDLKSHLVKQHDKKMYAEYSDRVVPYKLSASNVYECQVCGFSFETFGSIERHMNVHFRNYVCKECGSGFVTKYRLKVHTKSMHIEGNFPCDICKKVFTTQQKHKNHVDTVHKMLKRFKCPKCSERFSEYFRRQKHLVQVHGVAPLQYKCNVCEKTFDRRYTLSRHMKRDHLEERDYECQLCTYKCFTNNELRVHMIKHFGERVHECSVCKKSYARKKTLREHMRIHNNDRRFACAVCGQAFVQKCSLKGHIKTHHLEYNLQ